LVKHADNSGLTNGNVVYTVGSDGINKTVRLARANSETTSANTFGVMTEDATGGNKAFCTTFGLVRDLNTSALTEGALVWLSATTAGEMTSTRPTAPNHAVQVGFCIRSHSTQGVIFVSVQNGYELDELHDVAITSPTNGNVLTYNSGSGIWEDSAPTSNGDSTFAKINGGYIGKRITDTIQRTAPLISPLWDKAGATYNVAAYGIFPDGTDITARYQQLWDTVYVKGGGHIVFNQGTYLQLGLIKPRTNYNGSNIPQTPDVWISGAASNQSGNAQKPTGGTIIDCRYQGDTIGCYQFRGTGQIKITDISFIKGTTGLTNTFIHTTLATLKISDCAFWGYGGSDRCRAIVLGGNTAFLTAPDSSAEMGFQGYGTTIEKNYFNYISTGVMFQTYANAVVVRDNNFWNGCGGFAAIWLAAKNDTNTGNVIQNNLIEMNTYTYGIYIGSLSVSNTITANNFYDGPSGSKNIGSAATSANLILEGFNGVGKPFTGNTNVDTRISMQSGDTSYFASNILYRTGNFVGMRGGLGERIYSAIPDEYFQTSFSDISGIKNAIWRYNTGGVSSEVIQMQDFNPTVRFTIRADATDEFGEFVSAGNMRIKAKNNGELYIGSGNNLNHLFLSGILYGGLTSTTTTLKMGLSDKIYWGDTTSPFSGESTGLTSTSGTVLRTVNGSGNDTRHQASEFYATGTGANYVPKGTTAQRPTPSAGEYPIRFNTTINKHEGWDGSAWQPFY